MSLNVVFEVTSVAEQPKAYIQDSERHSSALQIVLCRRKLQTYTGTGAYFNHRDWLGNLRVLTDQTGAIKQTCSNLPYGDAQTCTAVLATPTFFTGYMRDFETNLDFANARYYTSQYGRFMSPDPLGGNIADPQSFNRYAYVENSPLSGIDPTGMDNCVIGEGGGAVGIDCGPSGGGGGGGGPFGGAGGPFSGGFSGIGGGGFGLCTFLDCGFGFGGAFLPGPPSASQIGSELLLNDNTNLQYGYSQAPEWLTADTWYKASLYYLNDEVEGVWQTTVHPVAHAIAHPIDTVAGLFHALFHPVDTTINIYSATKLTAAGVIHGDPQAIGNVAGIIISAKVLKDIKSGTEYGGKNFRVAPWGNRTGHPTGRFPHYHRRGTTPGQGIGRHRPWDIKSPDTSFWDRF